MILNDRDKIAKEQINEAITALDITSDKVRKFRKEHGRWPGKSSEILNTTDLYAYQYIDDISIVKQLLVVTFKNDGKVLAEFAGKSFALFGSESNGKLEWTCGWINIALEYLPAACKRNLK